MRKIRNIVIHCSATPDGDARFGLADLDKMHRSNGWAKIGYHWVIEIDGAIRAGRAEAEIGAHVSGSNADSIGVCMVGTARFTRAQWESLADLATRLKEDYPGASFWGHRDFSPDLNGDGVIEPREWFKLCPGFKVEEWLMSGREPEWNLSHLMPEGA